MTPEIYESQNRRAEVHGLSVKFQRITGKQRRSTVGVWETECEDVKHARRLAKRWAFMARLGLPVLH